MFLPLATVTIATNEYITITVSSKDIVNVCRLLQQHDNHVEFHTITIFNVIQQNKYLQ